MKTNYAESRMDADDSELISAIAVESEFAPAARAHASALSQSIAAFKALQAAENEAITMHVEDSKIEALRTYALTKSAVGDIIRRLIWTKWPEAASAWFNRRSVDE